MLNKPDWTFSRNEICKFNNSSVILGINEISNTEKWIYAESASYRLEWSIDRVITWIGWKRRENRKRIAPLESVSQWKCFHFPQNGSPESPSRDIPRPAYDNKFLFLRKPLSRETRDRLEAKNVDTCQFERIIQRLPCHSQIPNVNGQSRWPNRFL